jgi:hypothetical protein
MRLPEPMLAKSAPLSSNRGWSFEPKWDGFRAIARAAGLDCPEIRSAQTDSERPAANSVRRSSRSRRVLLQRVRLAARVPSR